MKYTIGTLVTDWDQFQEMRDSFIREGFSTNDCEFITVDNSGGVTAMDAFRGNNYILNQARGQYVILCHQDVRLRFDTRKTLDNQLNKLTKLDPAWGLAGNAGGIEPNKLALRITDPFGYNQNVNGPFPVKTQTLDGNFMVVRNGFRLGFSHDLQGFHFYDADICLHAELMGLGVYVIDFHLQHLSAGNTDATFYANRQTFVEKWTHKLRKRPLQLTTTLIQVGT